MWPTPQDYNEIIQNPHLCFDDKELQKGRVETNALGLPRSASGTFASVYKLITPKANYAVRCFLSDREDQEERYKHISEFVLFDRLDCTIDFHYIAKGIKFGREWYPILKMPWVEGPTLENYLSQIVGSKEKLAALARDFYKLSMDLETAGIAHGDLQHGNIIVSPQGLRLVDYDAFFVPKLQGRRNLEFGHPNYQHPLRDEFYFDVTVDNFSSWLIYLSLKALMLDSTLFEQFSGGDDCLLFKRADLHCPEESILFKTLESHQVEELRDISKKLKCMLWVPPHLVPDLEATPEELEELQKLKLTLPEIRVVEKSQTSNELNPGSDAVVKQRRSSVKLKARGIKQTLSEVFYKAAKSMSPSYYLTLKTLDVRDLIDKGAYEEAHTCYTEIRELHTKLYPNEGEQAFGILLQLAYCATNMGSTALANNYCLLAAQTATVQSTYYAKMTERLLSEAKGNKSPSTIRTLRMSESKFFKALSEFLYFAGGRKNPKIKSDGAMLFEALIKACGNLVSNPSTQIIMTPLLDLVSLLESSGRFTATKKTCAQAANSLLSYSGLWHITNSSNLQQTDYREYWRSQRACLRAITNKTGDRVIMLRSSILERTNSSVPENSDFIEYCNADRAAFKSALAESFRLMDALTVLNVLNPSLNSLKLANLNRYEETIQWLWTEVVSERLPFTTRNEWLKNFDEDTASNLIDIPVKE